MNLRKRTPKPANSQAISTPTSSQRTKKTAASLPPPQRLCVQTHSTNTTRPTLEETDDGPGPPGRRQRPAPFACATAGLCAALGWRRWCLPLEKSPAPTKNPHFCGFLHWGRGHRQTWIFFSLLPSPRSGLFLPRSAFSFLLSLSQMLLSKHLHQRKWMQQPRKSPPAPAAYRKSDSTPCGSWLACATMAVPACCRICARDRLAVSTAKSAS